MKILKAIGIAFAAVGLVLAVLAAFVVLSFDAARIKQEAAQAVLARTGRTLSIDGDLALSFWPSLGVKANKVTLSEANGKDRFAAFDAAQVSVQVMPLLSKRIAAERIELVGLKLVLLRDRDGHLNIDDLIGGKKAEGEKAPPPEFDVVGVNIANAQIEWRDQRSGRELKITDLDLSTGRAVGDKDGLRIEAVKLATRGKLDADNFDLAFEVPAFTRKGEQIAAAKVSLKATLKGAARSAVLNLGVSDIEGLPQALRIGGIALDLDAQLGAKSLQGSLKSPLALDLDAGSLRLTNLSGALELDMPGLPARPLKLPITGRIQSEYGKPALSGSLATQFDDTHVDARFNIVGTTPPNIGLELDIDRLNVDKYLPPATAQEEKPGTDRIDLSALKSLNASGSLRVGELQAKNLKARNVRVSFRTARGIADIAPHAADLYGGRLAGALTIDANSNRIALKEALSGIDIQALLKDLAAKDMIEGRGDVALDIALRGDTVASMKKSLAGSARIALQNGAIKGINIAQSLREAKAKLHGGDVAQQASATDKTDFSELGASFTIANGVAHNDDLAAKSPFLRLGGSGDIDIGNSRLDYLLKAAVVGTAAGQGGKELDALKGVTVPVRVSGAFEKPVFRLELANLVNEAAKQRLEEKQQEVKQKVQDKLKGRLKGLFEK